MADIQSELAGLKARLDQLERSNRHWRRTGLGSIAAIALLASLGFTVQKTEPDTVRAHKFELLGASGRVLASLDVESAPGVPEAANLQLRSSDTELADLTGSGLVFTKTSQGAFAVSSISATGMASISQSGEVVINSGSLPGDSFGRALGLTAASGGGPLLQLTDMDGFRTQIGVVSTVTTATGETQKTSAASIVMFGGKDGKVIWQAPGPYIQ